MTDDEMTEALAFFEKCKEGPEGWRFQNFRSHLIDCLITRMYQHLTGETGQWTNRFEEFVLMEVRCKNRTRTIPRYNLMKRFGCYAHISYIRSHCVEECGVSPRIHAKVHRRFINVALNELNLCEEIKLYYPF
jgi:hypothetical protein